VTIYPNPVANFTTANVCNGFASTFTNSSTGASTYSWNFGNGNSSTATNPNYTYPTAGTYTVTLTSTSSNGCVNTVAKSYTVNSSPKAAFTGGSTCLGNSITFNNTSTGAASNSWNFGDATTSTVASPSKTYTAAGNYTVKLVITNSFGCKDSVTNAITIFAKPVPAFTASNQCLGNAVTFTNQSTGANSQVWVFGDGKSSAANSPTYTYASANTYSVKLVLTSVNSCRDSINKTVTVFPRPSVSFTASPDPICRGGLMSFTNTTTNGATYSWTFGNGSTSTSTSPTNIYNVAGNYTVKLVSVSTNGCRDSLSKTVTVWPRPVASFKVDNGCTGDALSFATNSVGAVGHEWTFGDGNTSTAANPSKGYTAAATYSVRLIVTSVNGCKDTTSSNVTVHPRASVSFTNPTNFCVGLSTTFANTSTLSSGTMTYQWNFGDGNSGGATNPTNTYASAGNYTVKLTATTDKGCINTATSSVLVFAKPTANFNANAACAGNTVTFNNTTTGGTTYSWDFGDATTSTLASPTKIYAAAGTYTVKLTATNANSCSDVFTKTIIIHANPTANFTATDRCLGQAISFTNTSAGANDVLWQFGDGSSSNNYNPTYTYSNAGSYSVVLNIESINGCLSSVTKTVNVFASPKVAFSVNDASQCINGNTFVYNDNSTIASGTLTRLWSFGDGSNSTATNPTKVYSTSANFTIKLVVTSSNGCKDSTSSSVTVNPKPTANFTINKSTQCLNGNLFSFTDASSLSQGSLNHNWALGDGSVASGTNAVRKYNSAGTYTIRLGIASDLGCIDSISKTVTVYPSPLASFTVNDDIQCLNGNNFSFTNTSSGATGYSSLWNLGDGSTITTPNASRTYTIKGNYKVTLNVSTPFGCKDSAYYTMKVLANPSAITISGPNTAANGSTQIYSVTATPGSTYNWLATNGTVLSNGADRIQIRWNAAGTTGVISVTETGENGCQGNPANYNVTLSPTNSAYNLSRNAFAANLYPNPSTSNFTIEVGTGDMVNLSVYDQLGREVMGGKRFSTSITVSDHNLASGIYTVKLVTDKGRTTILRFEVKN
jgi:PKD repeat protein